MRRDWVGDRRGSYVKICGVTSIEDAILCIDHCVDSIGLLLERPDTLPKIGSTRLPINLAAEISKSVRGKIGVFTLIHTDREDLLDYYASNIQPDAMQICVDVPLDVLSRLRLKWPEISLIHSVRVVSEEFCSTIVARIRELMSNDVIDGVILDSAKGGSGKTHDWSVSARVVDTFPEIPMLLAGGLNADNAVAALQTVRCEGVDVMTSVNSSDGRRKDGKKINILMSTMKGRFN